MGISVTDSFLRNGGESIPARRLNAAAYEQALVLWVVEVFSVPSLGRHGPYRLNTIEQL